MRKRLKRKRRSCALCKPYKTGGAGRWSVKEAIALRRDEREIQEAVRRDQPQPPERDRRRG